MKSKKRETSVEIEIPNPEWIRTIGGKENNKFLGLLEAESIK